VGRYCHICGQDLLAGRGHNLREIANDSLGTIFAWDNKVFRTLWYLVAFPGRLTQEFYAGRIVRYVYPSKLFWFITIVFFALLLGLGQFDDLEKTEEQAATSEQAASEQVETTEQTPPVEVVGSVDESGGMTASLNVDDGLFDDGKALDTLAVWAPYFVLLLMPVFAFLMWLFFRRRDHPYSDYLVFSLHVNSFVFLSLSLLVVIKAIFPTLEDIGGWFVLWIPAIYLAFATRRVYRPRVAPMIFKILLLGFIYLLLMITLAAIFIMIFAVFIK
jgi:hypothetical protein